MRPHMATEPPDRGVHIERLTTGFASPAEDYLEAPLSLDELVARHPAATFFLEMSGDAMLPTLHPRDILVRRYQPGMHATYLVADNPKVGAIRLREGTEQQAWGVVTHLVRSVALAERPPRAQ